MSSNNSSSNQLRRTPTGGKLKAEHQIELIDHTKEASDAANAAQRLNSDASSGDETAFKEPLRKRLTSNSIAVKTEARRQLNKRKYAKYQHGHPSVSSEPPPDSEAAERTEQGEEAAPAQTSRLERARAKAFWKRKKAFNRAAENDTVLDILYENQRGAFLFGVPVFSASSLLNFDPTPWQNSQLRTSPVDIRNAQVPDPSWEWAWKTWYVDMSRDVDEEGWEYSFSFQRGFAWHGNHPWFHSFVRRRRWLRKRVRKDRGQKPSQKGHALASDYFTIHPRTVKERPPIGSRASSAYLGTVAAGQSSKQPDAIDEHPDVSNEGPDIADIASLMRRLRRAAVDREKLVLVRNFIASGGEELYYLSPQMGAIMNLFIFQSSRRQLLAELMQNFDTQAQRKEDLATHAHTSDEEAQHAHDIAIKRADNLLAAVKAADDQVKELEYWSDIKGMAQQQQTLAEDEEGHGWSHSRWAALDPQSAEPHDQIPFSSKQRPSQPAAVPHPHPEHGKGKGKARLRENAAPRGVTFYEDAKENTRESDSTGFTTAAESVSGMKDKVVKTRPLGQRLGLDGVGEEEEDGGVFGGEKFEDEGHEAHTTAAAGDLDPSTGAGDGEQGGGDGAAMFSSPSESSGLRRWVTPPETSLDAAVQEEGEKGRVSGDGNGDVEENEENVQASSPSRKRFSGSKLADAVPEPVGDDE
ncbi:hypothetical protein MBLNU230_g3983t1 [Neophaeotheca triangularis]